MALLTVLISTVSFAMPAQADDSVFQPQQFVLFQIDQSGDAGMSNELYEEIDSSLQFKFSYAGSNWGDLHLNMYMNNPATQQPLNPGNNYLLAYTGQAPSTGDVSIRSLPTVPLSYENYALKDFAYQGGSQFSDDVVVTHLRMSEEFLKCRVLDSAGYGSQCGSVQVQATVFLNSYTGSIPFGAVPVQSDGTVPHPDGTIPEPTPTPTPTGSTPDPTPTPTGSTPEPTSTPTGSTPPVEEKDLYCILVDGVQTCGVGPAWDNDNPTYLCIGLTERHCGPPDCTINSWKTIDSEFCRPREYSDFCQLDFVKGWDFGKCIRSLFVPQEDWGKQVQSLFQGARTKFPFAVPEALTSFFTAIGNSLANQGAVGIDVTVAMLCPSINSDFPAVVYSSDGEFHNYYVDTASAGCDPSKKTVIPLLSSNSPGYKLLSLARPIVTGALMITLIIGAWITVGKHFVNKVIKS